MAVRVIAHDAGNGGPFPSFIYPQSVDTAAVAK